MSQYPSHILIRFIVIALLTSVHSPFLSARIRVKTPPQAPTISQPEPTELLTWQQNVARDAKIWKQPAKKGWFQQSRVLGQKEINKIIQQYNPYKEANKEPVQPKKEKKPATVSTKEEKASKPISLFERVKNWKKRNKQLTDQDEAFFTFIEAQGLNENEVAAKAGLFKDCFYRLDEQHKFALIIQLQKVLDKDLKRRKGVSTTVPHRKDFAVLLNVFLQQELAQALAQKQQEADTLKTKFEKEFPNISMESLYTELDTKIEQLETTIQKTSAHIQGVLTTLLHDWNQPKAEKDRLISIVFDPNFNQLLDAPANEEIRGKWVEIDKTKLNPLFVQYSQQSDRLKFYQGLQKDYDQWLKVAYEIQAIEQAFARKPIYAAVKKFIKACDQLTAPTQSKQEAPSEKAIPATTHRSAKQGETMVDEPYWHPIIEEEPNKEEIQAQKKYEKLFKGFTWSNPDLPFPKEK
ncbi:MAG: hypothetical protein WCW33_04050 [Candidatus Babeliales bacterium]|jgi:hypothetical protein